MKFLVHAPRKASAPVRAAIQMQQDGKIISRDSGSMTPGDRQRRDGKTQKKVRDTPRISNRFLKWRSVNCCQRGFQSCNDSSQIASIGARILVRSVLQQFVVAVDAVVVSHQPRTLRIRRKEVAG